MTKSNSDKKNKKVKKRKIGPWTDYFLNQGIAYIDYKKTNNLRKFINRQGRINLRKHTQLTVKNQHRAARAIKTAQEMGLLSRTIVEQTEEPQK